MAPLLSVDVVAEAEVAPAGGTRRPPWASPGTPRRASAGRPPGAAAARCRRARKASSWAWSSARVGARRPPSSQRFRVWWKRSILPWVWGWPGEPFFWRMPRYASRYSKLLRPPVKRDGVDGPVVGERGGGPAVGVAGRGEGRDHVVAADPPEDRAPEQVAGVVVEPGRDLDLAPVGQAPVGEVRLPDLVGRGGLEADPGAARALVRLGHDEARGVEDAPDGRGRRDRQALAPEVPGDRGRAGVEAAGGELASAARRSGRARRRACRAGWSRGRRDRGSSAVEAALPVPARGGGAGAAG